MKVKFMNFKEMAITQNTGMCSYLTIAWAVLYVYIYMYVSLEHCPNQQILNLRYSLSKSGHLRTAL